MTGAMSELEASARPCYTGLVQDLEESAMPAAAARGPIQPSGSGEPAPVWRTRAAPALAVVLLVSSAAALAVSVYNGRLGGGGSPAEPTPEALYNTKKHIRIWKPKLSGEPLDLKVLTYNLEWWKLFGKEGGKGGMSGKLIARHNDPPYDFMGFQECEDPWRVLSDGGLLQDYEPFVSKHSISMAYNKKVWKLLYHGQADVATDVKGKFSFGARGAQWMRLQHKKSNNTVFFLNHHGPLPINSGGQWGWWTTSHNLLGLIEEHGKPGDAVVFVGDFNANQWSLTVQEIKKHLHHAYSGSFFQGIDNVFTNLQGPAVKTLNMGRGGSDHDALTAIMRWGPHYVTEKDVQAMVPGKVGKVELNVKYQTQDDDWSKRKEDLSLKDCITGCEEEDDCLAWAWEPNKTKSPSRCTMLDGEPTKKHKAKSHGAYSGVLMKNGYRGVCTCNCAWATSAKVCKADDRSCCWLQCCGKFVDQNSTREMHV